ncbi:MAG: hypothetical protein QOE30_3542 [Mycobacterium sp.]|jgi:hypothetical protein|nr:hypothetical protein [Mycobacterium sp.]
MCRWPRAAGRRRCGEAGRCARCDEDIDVVEDRFHARGYGCFCGPDRGHSSVGEQAAESAHTARTGLETIRVWHLLYVVVDSPARSVG